MTAKQVIEKYKEKANVTESEWLKLCKRYGFDNRRISTFIYELKEYFPDLPNDFDILIKKEMQENLKH